MKRIVGQPDGCLLRLRREMPESARFSGADYSRYRLEVRDEFHFVPIFE